MRRVIALSLRGEVVALKLGVALQHSIPMPYHNKPDAENDVDDHAPRNVPLWNGDKARIDAFVMGEIPETMRQQCRRDEPGADPHAEQSGNNEQQRDIELNLLLEIIATHHGEAEIDACHHAHHDRGEREGQRRW